MEEQPEQLRDTIPPITSWQRSVTVVFDDTLNVEYAKSGEGERALTKPSSKPVLHLVILQARVVEEEARRAIAGVDGDERPF